MRLLAVLGTLDVRRRDAFVYLDAQRFEQPRDVVGPQRSTVLVGEHVLLARPQVAEPVAVALLRDLPGDERADSSVVELHDATARARLRRVLDDPPTSLHARRPHGQHAPREIDVSPPQPDQLGTAQTCPDGDLVQRAEPVRRRVIEICADLRGRPRLELVRIDARQTHAARRVARDEIVAQRRRERALHRREHLAHGRRAAAVSNQPVDEPAHVAALDVGQSQPPERARHDVVVDVAPVRVERRRFDVAALLASGQPLVAPLREPWGIYVSDSIQIVAERRLGWSEWKDIRFFLHWEGIAVLLGGLGLAALEFWQIPQSWPLAWFVKDYRVWIVLALALLVGLPPTIARGLDHLRARDEAARAQVEVGTVLYAIELRLLNLVSKIREAFAGQHTNTYQNHTLNECKSYFSTRASEVAKTCIIDVNYYRLTRSGSAVSLERALFTGSAHSRMRSTFSNAPGASREAKRLVKTISEGNSVFCADVTDTTHTEALHIKDGSERPYRTFLTVPVFRDKKSGAGERVIGMLSINSTHVDTLSASDEAILKVYAWLLAAAFEADGLAKRLPTECRVTSDDRGTLVVREIGAE